MAHGNPTKVVPAMLGGFIVLYGIVSGFVKERLYLSEALVAMAFGIVIGPKAINLVNPDEWFDTNPFTREFARYVIAIQVMAAGITLPKKYMVRKWRSLIVLFGPVMVVMWIVSASLMMPFIKLDILNALMIASCVTPTDPILANSIVKGRFAETHVPRNVRDVLSAESGANDGLGFPFLFFALYMLRHNAGHAIAKWFYWTWAYEVLLSIVIGIITGYVARKVLYFAQDRELIDKESFLSFGIALALFIVGCMTLIGSDDILACFCAGHSFTWDDWFSQETKDAHFQEVLDSLFNITFFVYFGTVIPWNDFNNSAIGLSPWRLVVVAILILILRRLPIVLALTKITPAFRSYRQAAFAGWFGPIGVGAVFFCELALEEAENDGPHNSRGIQVIRPVVFFLVLSSVIVHGITVPLLLIGKAVHTRTMSISSNNVLSQVVSRLSFANSREPNFQEHTIQISEPPVNMHKPGPVGGGQVNDSHSAIFNIPFERTITIDEAPRVSRHEVDFHKYPSPDRLRPYTMTPSSNSSSSGSRDDGGGSSSGRSPPAVDAWRGEDEPGTTSGSYDDGMLGMSRSDGEAKISHNSSHETTLNNVSGEPNSSMKQGRFLPPHMHNSNLDRQQRRWSTAAENYSGHGNVFFEGQQLPMHSRSMSQLHSTTLSPLVALRADQERAKSSPSVQGGRELRQQNSRRSDEIVELPNGELALYDDPYDLESERAFMENRYIENPIRIINRWVSNRAGHIRGLFLRRGNPRHTDNNNNSNNSGRPT